VVGTAPVLEERLYPTFGTDDDNPTAVAYVNFLSPKCKRFVEGNLVDLFREFVLPGRLNLELRVVAYDPADLDAPLVADDDGGALAARAAQGVWEIEPENFAAFFEFMYWNFTDRTYTEQRITDYMRLGGVRNYVKIANMAGDDHWDGLVRGATEEAVRFDVDDPVVPRVRILRDHKAGNYWSLLDWARPRLDRTTDATRTTHTLLSDTEYATPVHVIDSGYPGPTAVVVGGIHGDERAGYGTAEHVARTQPLGGKLVVIPRANRPAIEIGARYTDDGDLNRQFPTGEEPTTVLARAIWDELAAHDPDVVVDLHTARNVYKYTSSVGQAIFPTVAGTAAAVDACDLVSEQYIAHSGLPSYYDFDCGNNLDGSRPLLVHKVYGDLGLPGYIVETARHDTRYADRLAWEFAAARDVLASNGLFLV
jgi:hypothetical protein